MTTNIREVFGDEALEVFYWMPAYCFHASPPMMNKEEWQAMLKQRVGNRYFALYDDGKPVAGTAIVPMVQQVRGALLPMGGIYDVVTHPSSRRKGYARQLMSHALAEMRAQGMPVSCLYPFRESFYQRLGYTTLPQSHIIRFPPDNLAPLLKMNLDAGRVEMLPISEGYAAYLAYLQSYRQRTHGFALFENEDWGWAKRDRHWLALARAGDEVVGVMLYRLKGEEVTKFTFSAFRFYYHTSLGRYLLLDWIARHIDQASQAEIVLPPCELPETWLADMKVAKETFWIAGMGRAVDLQRLKGLRCGPGRFTALIRDPHCPWNEGMWVFDAQDGILDIQPAQQAECELSIQAVSTLVYGTHDPADFSLRGWGDPDAAVQENLRSMFPRQLPYLHEMF